MKTILIIFFVTINLTGCAKHNYRSPVFDEQQIQKEVLGSFESLKTASKNLDLDGYLQLINPDKFSGLNVDGINWNNYEEFKQSVTPGFTLIKEIHSLEFPNVEVIVIDANTAILVNEYIQKFTLTNGKTLTSIGGGTQVWSKASGRWLLVSISASLKN